MGNIVSDGACLLCNKGLGIVKLAVSSSSMSGESKNLANTSNYSLSAPGTQCMLNPSVPSPCKPSIIDVTPGQSAIEIDGSSALDASCKFKCAKTGELSVLSPGQSAVQYGGGAGAASAIAAAAGATTLLKADENGKDKNDKDDAKKQQSPSDSAPEERNDQTASGRTKKGSIDPSLPKDPFNDPNFENISHPEAAKNGHYEFRNKTNGDVVRYDVAKPGEAGHGAVNHYHRKNPNSTSKMDEYLDGNGKGVRKGSDASHLYPPD